MKNPRWDLIVGFQEGDTTAFRSVYDKYHRALYYFVRQLVGDADEAEDIVAETFVKLWNLRANFDTENNIKAFLYITARNASLNYLRSQKRLNENHKELTYLTGNNNDDPVLRHEVPAETQLLEMIQDTLENLPSKQREVLEMILFEGLTVEEVAVRLNKSPKTVHNLKSIAINFVRLNLDRKKLAPAILLFYFSLI
jgi:RNA polymerase sigma-70 factor (family 1)